MVYDKDYYELLILIEDKIQSIEKVGQEINLSDDIIKQLENIKKVSEDAYEAIDNLRKITDSNGDVIEIFSEENFNSAMKKYERLQELSKEIKALEEINNGSNQLAASELIKLKAELLKLTTDIGDELDMQGSSNTDILTAATNIYDEYKKQKDILEEQRRELLKIEREQNKILEQTKEWKKNVGEIKKGYQQFTNSIKKSFSIIKDATEYWRKQDEQITKMVATFGLTTEEFKKYRDASYKAGVDLAFQYGKTQEDMVKLQQGYAEATGKNIILTKENYEAQFQLQRLMGDENSLGFTSGIEQFGVNIDDARDKLYEVYKLNKTTGVSWSKTSKDITTNLKLAQKYNFKGGLENMMRMTVWANKMKINLQTIGSIADKISNPESAIETAAKLQVLGGTFASLANPLQMLYESLDDVGGLAKRVEKMFDGMGSFDRQLGEVRIAGPDRMRVKAAAEAMGMSYEEAMNVVNNKAKRTAINQDVKFNPDITDDNKDFLATLAQWDNKKKEFQVRTYDEENKKFTSRNINELSNEDIEKLRQEPDEDIKKLVENTFSINENIDKIANGIKMSIAATQEDKYGGLLRDSLKNGNDMLSQMDTIGSLIDKFYLAWLAVQAFKAGVGAFKMGKGHGALFKSARAGTAPNTFGGKTATNMVGKGQALNASGSMGGAGALSRRLGIAGAIVSGGYGIYKTVTNANEAMDNRALAIQNGDLIEGSAQDKKILREIKKDKYKGVGGAIGGAAAGGLGAWGGAAAGAAIGTAILPGVGTLVGGILGGLGGGAIGGYAGNAVGSTVGDAVSVDDGIVDRKTVIKANKDDTALFAKNGGPFDKLFEGILPKVNQIYDSLNNLSGKPIIESNKDLPKDNNIIIQKDNKLNNSENNKIGKPINENSTIYNSYSTQNYNNESIITTNKNISYDKILSKTNSVDNSLNNLSGKPIIESNKDIIYDKILPKNTLIDNSLNNLSGKPIIESNKDIIYDKILSKLNDINNSINKTKNKAISLSSKQLSDKEQGFVHEDINNALNSSISNVDNIKSVISKNYNNEVNSSPDKNIVAVKPIGENISEIQNINNKEINGNISNKSSDIKMQPIDININGTLKLDLGNSNQVDIMKELKNNPSFMRELSRMLVEQMSSSLYGGKPKLDQNRFARFQS